MAIPTVAGILQVCIPAYVRKLRRRSDWGDSSDDEAKRAKEAAEKLFRSQAEPDISLYLVSTDEDLRRVALGLNAGRDSLKEAIPFVAFLPDELEEYNIQALPTAGNLPCGYANRLHYDMTATDEQLIALCQRAMSKGRLAGNCSSGMMKDVIDEATSEKCRTVNQVDSCRVTNCPPPQYTT